MSTRILTATIVIVVAMMAAIIANQPEPARAQGITAIDWPDVMYVGLIYRIPIHVAVPATNRRVAVRLNNGNTNFAVFGSRGACNPTNGTVDNRPEATNASIDIRICNDDGGLIEVFSDLEISEISAPPLSKRVASAVMPSSHIQVRITSFSTNYFQEAQNNTATWAEQYVDARLLLSTQTSGFYGSYGNQQITDAGFDNWINGCDVATTSICTPGSITGTNTTYAGFRTLQGGEEVCQFTARVLDSTVSQPPPDTSTIPQAETDDTFITEAPREIDPNTTPVPDQVIHITGLEGLGGGGGGGGTQPNPTRIAQLPPLSGPITSDPANEKVFTSHAPIIETFRIKKENEDGTYDAVIEYTGLTTVNRYEIEIDQPTATKDGRDTQIYPINNLYSGTYEFTTLADDGQMNVRVRGAYECPATETDGCDLIVDGADYLVPAGEKEYTRWSRRYYVAIGLLQIPKVSEGTTIDPTGVGRWEGAEELQQLTGGILGELFGLEAGEERNTALVMWMLVCLVIAIWVYVKGWRKSGSKSGLSPIGAALATISLVFTWSILGYVFFDMKAGTAWLPLAAILFFVIIKTWHTVKSR